MTWEYFLCSERRSGIVVDFQLDGVAQREEASSTFPRKRRRVSRSAGQVLRTARAGRRPSIRDGCTPSVASGGVGSARASFHRPTDRRRNSARGTEFRPEFAGRLVRLALGDGRYRRPFILRRYRTSLRMRMKMIMLSPPSGPENAWGGPPGITVSSIQPPSSIPWSRRNCAISFARCDSARSVTSPVWCFLDCAFAYSDGRGDLGLRQSRRRTAQHQNLALPGGKGEPVARGVAAAQGEVAVWRYADSPGASGY